MSASFKFTDPTVRDNSAEALGTAMKVVGEKQIMVFMTDLDNIKMTKVSILHTFWQLLISLSCD
jgi:hypothetical protein